MLTIRFRRFRTNVVLLLTVGASLWASQAAAQVRMPTHVACVGDSITYGYMASSAAAAYPSVLQNLFGSSVQVMNYGHNSATMLSTGDLPYQTVAEYTAATTFASDAGATAVVDVIIMLGTNDPGRRPPERHRVRAGRAGDAQWSLGSARERRSRRTGRSGRTNRRFRPSRTERTRRPRWPRRPIR
jgi:hypothetical protein